MPSQKADLLWSYTEWKFFVSHDGEALRQSEVENCANSHVLNGKLYLVVHSTNLRKSEYKLILKMQLNLSNIRCNGG